MSFWHLGKVAEGGEDALEGDTEPWHKNDYDGRRQGPHLTLKKALPAASGLGNQTRMDDIQQTNATTH